jgi:hypothetical protein
MQLNYESCIGTSVLLKRMLRIIFGDAVREREKQDIGATYVKRNFVLFSLLFVNTHRIQSNPVITTSVYATPLL